MELKVPKRKEGDVAGKLDRIPILESFASWARDPGFIHRYWEIIRVP